MAIVTQTLEQGNVGHALFQQLQANGGTAPYAWSVSTAGDPLPQGLTLSSQGAVSGTPEQPATASVIIVVQDAKATLDTVGFAFEVRDVEIQGGTSEAVTPGQQLTFTATGGAANYQFTLAANNSGGAITTDGSYTAGGDTGVDVVRVTDTDGFFEETSVTVGDDPFVGFQAIWGTTDVWYVEWDVVYDPAPTYATDFDEVLVALGLRRMESTGGGTEADQLARLLTIRRTLGHLSTYYQNSFDGNPETGGFSISFVGPSGTGGAGTTPSVGGTSAAAPNRYNTICVRHGPTSGVVGTAWLDNNNTIIEHDCGNPSGTALGVFANRILPPYLQSYNNSIASNPVGPSDVDSLRAMLLGASPVTLRERDIFDVADGFGRVLGSVLAHEIGHSLGLNHANPGSGPGDIMNASLVVSPLVFYSFNSGDRTYLSTYLPGINRN